MIWVNASDQRKNDNGAKIIDKSVMIGGKSFTYQNYKGSLPQMVLNSNASNGTIDILGVLHYLQSIGQVSTSATIGELDFGWEICNTAGQTLTYVAHNYTLTMS